MITPGLCTSVKLDWITGVHQPTDQYKIALYNADAILNPETRTYTPAGEIRGEGYVPGGQVLNGFTARMDRGAAVGGWLTPPLWPNATMTAHGALIYNASKGNRALVVIRFDRPVSSTAGDFRLLVPPVEADTALLRIF